MAREVIEENEIKTRITNKLADLRQRYTNDEIGQNDYVEKVNMIKTTANNIFTKKKISPEIYSELVSAADLAITDAIPYQQNQKTGSGALELDVACTSLNVGDEQPAPSYETELVNELTELGDTVLRGAISAPGDENLGDTILKEIGDLETSDDNQSVYSSPKELISKVISAEESIPEYMQEYDIQSVHSDEPIPRAEGDPGVDPLNPPVDYSASVVVNTPKKVKKSVKKSFFNKKEKGEYVPGSLIASEEAQDDELKNDPEYAGVPFMEKEIEAYTKCIIYGIIRDDVKGGANLKELRNGLNDKAIIISDDHIKYFANGMINKEDEEKGWLVYTRKGVAHNWSLPNSRKNAPNSLVIEVVESDTPEGKVFGVETLDRPEEGFMTEIIDRYSGDFKIDEAKVVVIGSKYNIPATEITKFIMQTQKITNNMLLVGDNEGLTEEKIREAYNGRDVLVDELSADDTISQMMKFAKNYEQNKETLEQATLTLKTKKQTQQQLQNEINALKTQNQEMSQDYKDKQELLNEAAKEMKEYQTEIDTLNKKLDAQATIVASDSSNLDHAPSAYFSATSRQAYKKLLEVAPVMVSSTFKTPWIEYHALEEMAANLLGVENGVVVEEPGWEEINILLNGDDTMLGLKQIRMDPKFPSKKIGKTVDAFIAYAETLKDLKENEQVIKNE
ncbi:MAG: hypothetical protein KJ697_00655 [Nanoarchaeota archaeon]|nr:hypothetical protein [Nanoarchaeota archaeon]